jgi:hypothetical protein
MLRDRGQRREHGTRPLDAGAGARPPAAGSCASHDEPVAVIVHLLGHPHVDADGAPAVRARGRKSWAILAYLAAAERPVPRERLAGMLFGEADDPLRALRWSLVDARRLLGVPDALTGEPLQLDPLVGSTVDVRILTSATWMEAEVHARVGPLLEGITFPANPTFDAWLASERYHIDAVRSSVLREATLGRLAAGDPTGAWTSAQALVLQDPRPLRPRPRRCGGGSAPPRHRARERRGKPPSRRRRPPGARLRRLPGGALPGGVPRPRRRRRAGGAGHGGRQRDRGDPRRVLRGRRG